MIQAVFQVVHNIFVSGTMQYFFDCRLFFPKNGTVLEHAARNFAKLCKTLKVNVYNFIAESSQLNRSKRTLGLSAIFLKRAFLIRLIVYS